MVMEGPRSMCLEEEERKEKVKIGESKKARILNRVKTMKRSRRIKSCKK
jgi:hypothetical protein